jgi:hypothetical protein
MPDIDKIPAVFHKSTDPYHFIFDNIPLETILQRQGVINAQVDNNTQDLGTASGSEGSVANRLVTSLEDNGDLKTSAIDDAIHSVAAHEDADGFVRMTDAERAKLGSVSDDATALTLQFNTVSTTPVFADETVEFDNSDTAVWNFTSPNKISLDLAFPASAVHQEFFDRIPVHENGAVPDYLNYKTTTVSTPFISGTLRVYINGIRLTEGVGIWVPPSTGPSGTWILTYFTGAPAAGKFTLNRSLDPADIIRIDFNSEF